MDKHARIYFHKGKIKLSSLTVILTVWKRNYLEDQLQSIYNQTSDIDEIIVYQNESHLDISDLRERYGFTHIHNVNKNFKFHGRFTLPLVLNTDYVAIFDDDTIPNPGWLEYAVNKSRELNSIIGANGRFSHIKVGGIDFGAFNTEDVEVDFVGHCWVFKRDWVKNFWREDQVTLDNAEDIQFCASLKVNGGIRSFVPAQPKDNPAIWSDPHNCVLGDDDLASYKQQGHSDLRENVMGYWKDRGWTPVALENVK